MRPYKGSIKDDPAFRTLFNNKTLLIGHVSEQGYCCNVLTGEEWAIYDFYGDPVCGLAGINQDWCLIGGDVLMLRIWIDDSLRQVGDLRDIFDLRMIDAYTVHILTDPWAADAAIWQLTIDLTTLIQPISLAKLSDFKGYIDQPYTEAVTW